jgi:thiol-disulfide isomerase/thioredoxin
VGKRIHPKHVSTSLASRLTGWLGNALLLVCLLLVIHWWQTRDMIEGKASDPMAENLPLLFADTLQTTQADAPYAVIFWAEWCPICRLELGTFASLAEDYRVISVASHSGSAREIQTFLQEKHLRMPVLVDSQGLLAHRWGVKGFPASFIVDADGRIRFRAMGYTSGLGFRLRLWLADFLR